MPSPSSPSRPVDFIRKPANPLCKTGSKFNFLGPTTAAGADLRRFCHESRQGGEQNTNGAAWGQEPPANCRKIRNAVHASHVNRVSSRRMSSRGPALAAGGRPPEAVAVVLDQLPQAFAWGRPQSRSSFPRSALACVAASAYPGVAENFLCPAARLRVSRRTPRYRAAS